MSFNIDQKEFILKAIIFDVGGVLIRTHSREKRYEWANRLSITVEKLEYLVFNSESGRQRQLGEKSNDAHWSWLGDYFGLDEANTAKLCHDFFAGDIMNKPLVEYIKRLRRANYQMGILSNYGDEARQQWTDIYPFIEYFDGVIISAEQGIMKPNPKIYHLAANTVGVEIGETLFIDDFIENVEGAKKVGMQAIHFTEVAKAIQELAVITGVV